MLSRNKVLWDVYGNEVYHRKNIYIIKKLSTLKDQITASESLQESL